MDRPHFTMASRSFVSAIWRICRSKVGFKRGNLRLPAVAEAVFLLVIIFLGSASSTLADTVTANFTSPSDIPVTAAGYTAAGNDVSISLGFAPTSGLDLTLINNTSNSFITGQFANLSQGQQVVLTHNGLTFRFVANYYGGTGNDLILHWANRAMLAWGNNNSGNLGVGGTASSKIPLAVNMGGVLAGKTVVSVSAGGTHSIALCLDGTVATWGSNQLGQLGNGSSVTSSDLPVAIDNTGALAGKVVVAVAAGGSHCLVLCSDGTMATWGSGSDGQLGYGFTNPIVRTPVAVTSAGDLSGRTVVAVSAGTSHNLALCSDGTVVAWGGNWSGQLGNGGSNLSASPVFVEHSGVLSGRTVVAVAAGYDHSLALCSDGTVAAWGNSIYGQLGYGGMSASSLPVEVDRSGVLSGKTVASIAAGTRLSLATCSDGTVAAWGYNTSGQLGDGSTSQSAVPVAVVSTGVLAGKVVVAVAAGGSYSLARCSDGTVHAWGVNGSGGQLGNGSTTSSAVPVSVISSAPGMTGRMMVAAGSGHSLAIAGVPANSKLSGLALITGNLAAVTDSQNTSFAASVSATTASVSVTPTVEVASSTVQVNGVEVVSGSHSGAIPLAEGINLISVLVTAEDGSSTSYTISVVRPADVTFQYTSATDLAADYPAFDATGLTANLSLGFSPATGTNLTIIRNTGIGFIAGQFTNLAQGQLVELTFNGVIYRFLANYYGGNGNDLVLEWASRDVRAWGLNTNGRLGDGSQTNRSLPVAVKNTGILSGRTVMAVEAGAAHSLALCYDGTVAAWGLNGSGRLGDGSTTSSSSPVAVDLTGVLSGKTVVAISAGGSHSLALCSDGTVSAWGANTSGQLGDGTTTSRELPVAVDATGALAGKSVVAVSAGAFRSVALCSDGSVVEWGNGSGIPAAVKRTGVLSGNTVVAVAAGGSHCLGLYSDGTIMAWGSNSSGQLGNGGTTSSSDPVGVLISGILAGKTVLGISAGSAHSLALCSDGTVVAWGSNSYGQIGDGSTTNRTAPVAVNGGIFTGRSVVTVAAGGHSLAICSDEAVAAWGFNNFGQLGNGTAIGSIVPIEVARTIVASGSSPVAISVGDSHNLAIAAIPANNRLSALTLSSGSLTPAFSPSVYSYAAILPEASASITVTPSVEDISAAVRVNGVDVISGNPSDSLPISVGINSIPIVVTAENGSAATYTVNALRKADINATYTSASDIPVVFPLYDATGLTVNLTLGFAPPTGTNLMVIKNTGIGFITGQFTNLAHGKALSLTHNGVTYDFVANYFGGNGNDLVLEWARRSIAAWGLNGDGQLGDNKYFDSRVPVKVIDTGFLSGKTVLSVSAGEDHSLALCSDGTVASWGKGFYGQLGKEGSPLSPVPVAVSQAGILSGKTVVAISTAFLNNLALCSDGTLASWGYGQGQLGNGTNSSGFVPVAVTQTGVLAGKSVVAISVGGYHSLALCSDGRVVAWGRNTYGQLGDGGMIDSNVPVLVPETGALVGRKVVAITTGLYHSLALCSDGTVVAWGRNITGQLGNGTTVDSVVPVSVIHKGALLGKTVTALSQGAEQHSVVLCADGTIVAWGGNNNGQLGRGTSSSFGSSPAAVSSTGILNGKTVVGVSSGYQHNIAICSDGAVATWGGNYSGALGNNGVFSSTAPVRVISTGELYGKVGLCGAGGMHCLIVTADPVGGYLGWIAGYAGLSNKTESGDPEGDGIPNLVEYVLHGNPGISATSIAPTISSSGTELVFSFNRVAASEENTTQIFQYSADMINWVNVPIFPAAEVALGTVDANGNQEVTVTVPKEANTQLFGRLKVSLP